ncbi:PREDICTED: translation initiation factor IF-2-like [Chinchilla lanigera]|uniref:translation initiation factor IF-2-like n=1 Tax=Chinchilla lanigera TaxID=34839 RepID=UPI000696512E|nr:PREDICTED: translation initiation factor IF-2-like [Chinchilla lanigera]
MSTHDLQHLSQRRQSPHHAEIGVWNPAREAPTLGSGGDFPSLEGRREGAWYSPSGFMRTRHRLPPLRHLRLLEAPIVPAAKGPAIASPRPGVSHRGARSALPRGVTTPTHPGAPGDASTQEGSLHPGWGRFRDTETPAPDGATLGRFPDPVAPEPDDLCPRRGHRPSARSSSPAEGVGPERSRAGRDHGVPSATPVCAPLPRGAPPHAPRSERVAFVCAGGRRRRTREGGDAPPLGSLATLIRGRAGSGGRGRAASGAAASPPPATTQAGRRGPSASAIEEPAGFAGQIRASAAAEAGQRRGRARAPSSPKRRRVGRTGKFHACPYAGTEPGGHRRTSAYIPPPPAELEEGRVSVSRTGGVEVTATEAWGS